MMRLPSSSQSPPVMAGSSPRRTAPPPSTGTLKIVPPVQKPTHCPSREKNGFMAPSVPASSVTFG